MRSYPLTQAKTSIKPYFYRRASKWETRFLGLAVFFVTTLPLSRIGIGPVPFYFVDVFLLVLLWLSLNRPKVRWQRPAKKLALISALFFLSVCAGEIRGMISYQFIFPGLYMIFRFGLGISLVSSLPRLVNTHQDFQVVLKAAVVGVLITSSLTVLSSLPPTRPIVAKAIFSNRLLTSTGADGLYKGDVFMGSDAGTRGMSLAGSVNITGAFICALWPLAFLAHQKLRYSRKWKKMAFRACIIAPFGALATYSRSAWLGVSLITFLMGFFGYGGRRRFVFAFVALAITIVSIIGTGSRFFQIDRVVTRTKTALVDPTGSSYEYERFMSYSEPFTHLVDNPGWALAGAGSAGTKMFNRGALLNMIYDQCGLATHSSFSMAYYNFGVLGVVFWICLIWCAITLILGNIRQTTRYDREERLTWDALLATMFGLAPWLVFGHGATSSARGSMFFFCMVGILLASEKLRMNSYEAARVK